MTKLTVKQVTYGKSKDKEGKEMMFDVLRDDGNHYTRVGGVEVLKRGDAGRGQDGYTLQFRSKKNRVTSLGTHPRPTTQAIQSIVNKVRLNEDVYTEGCGADKTEHSGAKKGKGAYYGRKQDAKKDSNKKRRQMDRFAAFQKD